MKKIILFSLILGVMLATTGIVVAKKSNVEQQPAAVHPAENQEQESTLPEDASYTTYHGKGIWSTTHILRKDDVKTEKVSKKPVATGPKCYKLMGVSWPITPNYVAQNNELLAVAGASIATWDNATEFDLLGVGTVDGTVTFEAVMNGQNSYSKGDYPLDGVIAVCRTWRDSTGNILEYDIMFDTDFTWADCTAEGADCIAEKKMDLQNIATHEIGHGFGLLDLYNRPCTEQTMYGYSWYGDMSKRDLASGDIAGIQSLYGTPAL